LLNLRGANLNPGAEPTDMISIRIWATDELVITTRAHKIRAVDDLAELYRANKPPATHGDLVTFIADRLTFRLEPIVAKLEEEADELEEDWLDQNTLAPKQKLAHFRRSALSLRRYIAPQKEALSSLVREGGEFLSDEAKLRLREIQDITTRLAEDLDLARERAVVIQEQIVEQRAEAMNQRLFVLAIISAVFLPLGFFTGLFGVNIGGMPRRRKPHMRSRRSVQHSSRSRAGCSISFERPTGYKKGASPKRTDPGPPPMRLPQFLQHCDPEYCQHRGCC
jgi:zinc transporter